MVLLSRAFLTVEGEECAKPRRYVHALAISQPNSRSTIDYGGGGQGLAFKIPNM